MKRGPRLVALLATTVACSSEPAPWEIDPANAPPPGPRLVVPEAGPPAPSASGEPEVRRPESGPGCDDGFRTSGEPRHDVVRLGLVCGPPEGFSREMDGIEGALAKGGASVDLPLELAAGRCYRIVAAADEGIPDLGVEVKSARDVGLATAESRLDFVVLPRTSAFCSEAESQATIVFRAREGRGRFAAEVWSRQGPSLGPSLGSSPPAPSGSPPSRD